LLFTLVEMMRQTTVRLIKYTKSSDVASMRAKCAVYLCTLCSRRDTDVELTNRVLKIDWLQYIFRTRGWSNSKILLQSGLIASRLERSKYFSICQKKTKQYHL
jgi:hypothetical protein